jgi:hypothetical protein
VAAVVVTVVAVPVVVRALFQLLTAWRYQLEDQA